MSARFELALSEREAPKRLGDVTLRYEPSMLVVETPRQPATLWPTVASWSGIVALLAALAALVSSTSVFLMLALAGLGALLLAAATRLERHQLRHRGFIANFATVSLRLDFVTPIAGLARTLIVPFDDVRAVELMEQADGASCLTVDFVRGAQRYREVLVAHITPAELEAALRLRRILEGAFGLPRGRPSG